jgi:transposase
MKQVTPSNREHYTHGCWLKNKEGVTMSIYFGVDFHARQQFVKWCDTTDGEVHEQQFFHRAPEEVREFYTRFQGEVIVGLEASGYSCWFETMLQQIGHQVLVGNPTEIRRRARSRQKTDRRDAELLLELLLKDEFPRLHRLTPASLEVLRQLRYRHRLVQMRTRIYNALQAIALSAGVSLKAKLRTNKGQERLGQLSLTPACAQQRREWLSLLSELNRRIAQVEQELEPLAIADPRVQLVRTHPGVGLLTGLALVHTLCPVSRFANSRKVTAYIGLEPREYSSGERQRFGGISKAGSRLLRFLLVEAGHKAIVKDQHLKKLYHRLLHRRQRAKAKVAVARHVLVHSYILLRDEIDYAEFLRRGVAVRSARVGHRPSMPDKLIERSASEQQQST